mgnify:CR=1 FL=1
MSIESMLCSEFNQSMMFEIWTDSISIQSHQIAVNSVQCDVTTGLEGTYSHDTRTRIQIVWSVFAHISTPVITPYNISIQNGIPAPPSSISSMVHHFPMNVYVEDVSGSEAEYVVWNRFDPPLTLFIDSPPPKEDNAFDVFVDFTKSYWYVIAFMLVSLFGLIFTILRNKNAIDFDADDDDSYVDDDQIEDEQDDEWEEMVDDIAEWDEEMESEFPVQTRRQPKPPAAVERDLSGQPKPPAAVQRDIIEQHASHDMPTRKVRKTASTDTSVDEIDFTHLVQSSNDEVSETENDDEMDVAIDLMKKASEQSMKKRRRPVRRKKSD